MESKHMYDGALLGILQNEEQILPFLDVIFGFLYRCTDFYRLKKDPQDKVGFLPGMAEKVTLTAFQKYEKQAKEDIEAQKGQEQLEEIVTPGAEAELKQALSADTTNGTVETEPEEEEVPPEEELDEEAKALKQKQQEFQSQADSYNGAIRDNYCWSQNIKELDVHVPVPATITKGKLVKVDMKHTHLSVKVNDGTEEKILLDGDLCWKINIENSCWTLRPGESVHINLEKIEERWWDGLLTDEPKINIRNIDAMRPMTDLGDDEQAKIQELMFNEQQKRLGKPTTEQMKIEKLLKEAWDKEGSPFKGQPFDPSVVNVSGSGDKLFYQKPA